MPRQTINQWSRRTEEEDSDEKENSPSCVPKMIVLLMNILSPKRLMIIHRRSPIRGFQKQTGRNWITKLNFWELVFEKLLFQSFFVQAKRRRSGLKDQRQSRKNNGLGWDQSWTNWFFSKELRNLVALLFFFREWKAEGRRCFKIPSQRIQFSVTFELRSAVYLWPRIRCLNVSSRCTSDKWTAIHSSGFERLRFKNDLWSKKFQGVQAYFWNLKIIQIVVKYSNSLKNKLFINSYL